MVPTLLATLRDRDIQVWADGERLRCSAPSGVLNPELREELQQRKREILQFLQSAGSLARQQRAIVPLQPRGTRPPVFAFGGHNGDVFCFRALTQHLEADQPFFGLQPPGFEDQQEPLARVEDLAAYFAAEIRAFQPQGPYVLAGYCAGGSIAFELARQLLRDGAAVSGLALFGAPYATSYRRLPRLRKRLATQVERLQKHARALASLPLGERPSYLTQRLRERRARLAVERPVALGPLLAQRARVERAIFAALRRYVPGHFAGRLSLFLPSKQWVDSREEPLRWRAVAQHSDEYFGPDGCHTDVMLREPYAPAFAGLFKQCQGMVTGDLNRCRRESGRYEAF
jgi:thioesterase domain-containing protein